MLVNNIILHGVAIISILYRVRLLWIAIKQHNIGKIKFELFLIAIIISLWVLLMIAV